MIKIKILTIGKIKEKWLELALDEYLTRLQAVMSIEWCLYKDDQKLYEAAGEEKNLIVLDADGKGYSSVQFSKFLFGEIEKNHSRLSFLIGGAHGIPKEFLQKSATLTLSPMTFSHQTIRLLLIEQIYRAVEINKGSAYHK